jgi:type I restriction enzyme R subunit
VYATNGRRIIEVDLAAGTQHEVDRFRTPEELWQNYCSIRQLNELGVRLFEVPYSRNVLAGSSVKEPRYYQHVAIQRLLQAIASGDRRLLTVLATGTGKSFLSAQLVHSLWAAHWPRGAVAPDPRPRVRRSSRRCTREHDRPTVAIS